MRSLSRCCGVLLCIVSAWLLNSCAMPQTPLLLEHGELPERLSEWHLFALQGGQLRAVSAAVQYELNTPLFSDYALKMRTLWVPVGQHIAPAAGPDQEPGALQFPVGTVLTKTFYYPRAGVAFAAAAARDGRLDMQQVRLLETRVLVHQQDGWHAAAYVWDDAQQDALIAPGGKLLQPSFEHPQLHRVVHSDYLVPDQNQCANCHARNHTTKRMQPLGPRLDNLASASSPAQAHANLQDRRTSAAPQLAGWRTRGWLAAADAPAESPPLTPLPALARWDDTTAPLAARAIAYLDVNCGHCHNSTGAADTSGLFLDRGSLEKSPQGVCKAPVAAGKGAGHLAYDLVPGRASESILLLRMQSSDPGVMMPELGRSLAHEEGVHLIRDWINSLPGSCPRPDARRAQPV